MASEIRRARDLLKNEPITITQVYEYNLHPGTPVDRGIKRKNLGINIYVDTFGYDHVMPTNERKAKPMAPNPFIYSGIPSNLLLLLVESRYRNMDMEKVFLNGAFKESMSKAGEVKINNLNKQEKLK